MILVFGSSGRTGKFVVAELLKKNADVRVMVRDAAKVSEFATQGVDIVEGQITDTPVLEKAFENVDKVYVLLGNSEEQLALEKRIVDMAKAKGVSLLVKQSSLEALPESTKPIPQLHVESEDYIKASGLPWVLLRPTFFAQMLLLCAKRIVSDNILEFPMAQASVAVTDARDVAEVAALVLTTPGHEYKRYELTGPELLSFASIAAIFSKVLGRDITYHDLPLSTFRDRLDSFVTDKWRVNAVCEELDGLANTPSGYTTAEISQLLGRQARSAEQFIRDHIAAFAVK